jgi:hypothetical protein
METNKARRVASLKNKIEARVRSKARLVVTYIGTQLPRQTQEQSHFPRTACTLEGTDNKGEQDALFLA